MFSWCCVSGFIGVGSDRPWRFAKVGLSLFLGECFVQIQDAEADGCEGCMLGFGEFGVAGGLSVLEKVSGSAGVGSKA